MSNNQIIADQLFSQRLVGICLQPSMVIAMCCEALLDIHFGLLYDGPEMKNSHVENLRARRRTRPPVWALGLLE